MVLHATWTKAHCLFFAEWFPEMLVDSDVNPELGSNGF